MAPANANALRSIDVLNVHVLVDNVTDSLSTIPPGVMHEWGHLRASGNLVLSGEALCCAAFGLSLVITARLGNAHHVLLFDAGAEAYAIGRNGDRLKIAFAAHVKGKGIVVFTACSHAGVINVLRDASRVFAGVPLYAVMGGFHLSGSGPEAIIQETVRDIQSFELKKIIPGHCTGWRATSALSRVFEDDVLVPCAVGRKFTF